MKKLKDKVNIAGRAVPVFILALFLIGGTALAAVLTVYGTISGTTEVQQSVLVDGESYRESLLLTDDGGVHTLTNQLDTEVTVMLASTCTTDIPGHRNDCAGLTTTYAKMGVLELTKKNTGTGQPIGTPIQITYTVVGDTFEVTGVPEGYILIYYKDKVVGLEGRLDNPQPAIIVTSEIGSFPHTNDANIDELADYCGAPDFYEHCKGAKLWLVRNDDLVNGDIEWANWNEIYFETDLITYTQDTWKNNGDTVTLEPNSELMFDIISTTVAEIMPGTYTIKTDVSPVTSVHGA